MRRENIPFHANLRPRAEANPTRVPDHNEAQIRRSALNTVAAVCARHVPIAGWSDSRSAAGR